jgi:hypothetical protein
LGAVVEAHLKAGNDLQSYGDFKSFLSSSVQKKFISTTDYNDSIYEIDGWGHPFVWDVKVLEDGLRIRISSVGPDGVDQAGEGDDIFVEVTVKNNLPPVVYFKPRPSGY